MQENLSIEEIGELFRAAKQAGAGSASGCVRAYDFARPADLPRSNVRALDAVLSRLGELWPPVLSAALRTESEVRVGPLQQGAFADLPISRGVIFILSMSPLPGRIFVTLPAQFALGIANRMAGGRIGAEREHGLLTRAETSILRCLAARLLPRIAEAWKPVAPMQCALLGCCTSPGELGVAGEEAMLSADLTCRLGTSEGRIGISFPAGSVKPVLGSLHPEKPPKPSPLSSAPMAGALRAVDMPVSIQLGRARASIREILGMETGDIVKLDTAPDDELDVRIGRRARFLARACMEKSKLSVQITGRAG
ncbi:MAG: flagellar motor switch protein FliM [Armatimonadota bacterium]